MLGLGTQLKFDNNFCSLQFQVVLLLVLGISSALSSPHPDFSVQPGDEGHDHHHDHHHHAHESHGREDEHHHEHHDHHEVSTHRTNMFGVVGLLIK
jgi:hypothetical protein